jgi:glyoxylase I family protein
MKIEHFAINVENPLEMADWYVDHLGMKIVRQDKTEPYMTFLADDSGRAMIEVYRNPDDQVPDYKNMNPLILHLAFVSDDPGKDRRRMEKAGARLVSDETIDDGSHIVMMRDPWGLAIQFCKRSHPMLTENEN